MTGTFNGVVEYSCLGDWFVGKNHYFAVANTKESRKDEKYRCFLKNRDDDLYIGVSITAEWWVEAVMLSSDMADSINRLIKINFDIVLLAHKIQ